MSVEKENRLLTYLKTDIVLEILFTTLGLIFFVSLFYFFPDDFYDFPYYRMVCVVILLSFLFLFLLLNQQNPSNSFFETDYSRNIILFSLLCFSLLSFLFHETYNPNWGIDGDNWYRAYYINRMKNSLIPRDYAYKGMSAFFPPLYWYVLAIIAWLFDIEAYKMIKLGFLFVFTYGPILLYESWKKLFDEKKGFIITIMFFSFIANFTLIDGVDHLLGFMFLIPYFMYYYENFNDKNMKMKNYIFGGFLGSLIFCFFFFYFFFIPFYYLVDICIDRKTFFKEKFKRIFFLTLFLLIFSSWFWLPLSIDILRYGFENHQYFFYKGEMLPFLFSVETFIFSTILALGLVFILLRYKSSKTLKFLGNIAISIYIFFIVSHISYLFNFPLMHVQFIVVLNYVLLISFCIFYISLFDYIIKSKTGEKLKSKINLKNFELQFLFFLIISQNYIALRFLYNHVAYYHAFNDDVPENVDIIKELDYEEKVFLTNYYDFVPYLNVYVFIGYAALYSHPAALHNERVEFLDEISRIKDPKEFYEEVTDNRFDSIDFFFLDIVNNTYLIFNNTDYQEKRNFDKFKQVEIIFPIYLFENPEYFKRREIKDKIIYETK